jgi:hypothetical protein
MNRAYWHHSRYPAVAVAVEIPQPTRRPFDPPRTVQEFKDTYGLSDKQAAEAAFEAARLSATDRVAFLRKLAGVKPQPDCAWGMTVETDARHNVLRVRFD